MDYFDLLQRSQQNNKAVASKEVRCYSTYFPPPKKLVKSNVSSENVKKFLARKEEEEKKKQLVEKKKKNQLLALRALDKKSNKRVKVMLKKTKSANKSVMEDAIDNVNTADTLAGPKMCDEDDYGYVSQEASALYEKLVNKYQNVQVEATKAKVVKEVKDITATRDRVKAALRMKEEEELNPHRKRKRKTKNKDQQNNKKSDKIEEDQLRKLLENQVQPEKVPEKVKKKKILPPVDFFQLLKIAEQKQHEPIIIEKKSPGDDGDRPMTLKQKLEQQRVVEKKIEKKSTTNLGGQGSNENGKTDSILNSRIPKKGNSNNSTVKCKLASEDPLKSSKPQVVTKTPSKINSSSVVVKNNVNDVSSIDMEIQMLLKKKASLMQEKVLKDRQSDQKNKDAENVKTIKKQREPLTKNIPPNGVQSRQIVQGKYITTSILPKKIPINPKAVSQTQMKKPVKRRVIDSESEYDSELDDFIDDGPQQDQMDISRHIKEIFGYDKSRYKDEGDECEVASFMTQMIEEKRSAKIGLMEDLEDIQREKEEKARILMRKNKNSLKVK